MFFPFCHEMYKQKSRKNHMDFCGMINDNINHGTTRLAFFSKGRSFRFWQTLDL